MSVTPSALRPSTSCDDKRSDDRPRRTFAEEGINEFLNPLVMFISDTSNTCWSYLKGSVVIFSLGVYGAFRSHLVLYRSFSLPPSLTCFFYVPKSRFQPNLHFSTIKSFTTRTFNVAGGSFRPDWPAKSGKHTFVFPSHHSLHSLRCPNAHSLLSLRRRSRTNTLIWCQLFFPPATAHSLLSLSPLPLVSPYRHLRGALLPPSLRGLNRKVDPGEDNSPIESGFRMVKPHRHEHKRMPQT